MSTLSQFLKATASVRATAAGQPGSNGYWRRDVFRVPGTYTWTATKAGPIKIQGIGAAGGGAGGYPGPSGAFGEKTLTVAVGDQLTIVIGQGGSGVNSGAAGNGTSTSISGTPVGAIPLTLAGATGANLTTPSYGAAGTTSGPWDLSYNGAVATATGQGSPSSGSPFGAGKASNGVAGAGGAGWGGGASGAGGASSHHPNLSALGAPGFLSLGGNATNSDGASQPMWDLRDADGGGGAQPSGGTYGGGGNGGIGAGGAAAVSGSGGVSALGGGTGVSAAGAVPKSGPGGGGGASNGGGGAGGDAWVAIFWDAVQ